MPSDNHNNNNRNPDDPINGAAIGNIRETDSVEITHTNSTTGNFYNTTEEAFIAPDGAVESRKTKHRLLHNGVPFDPNTYIGCTYSGLAIHEGNDYHQCNATLFGLRGCSNTFLPGKDGVCDPIHGNECTSCRHLRQYTSIAIFLICIFAIIGVFLDLWKV